MSILRDKDSARRTKCQIYLSISEPPPIFNLQKQVKVTCKANEMPNLFAFSHQRSIKAHPDGYGLFYKNRPRDMPFQGYKSS